MASHKFITWEDAVSWLIEQPDKQDIVMECYYDSPLSAAADRYWKSGEWQAVRAYLPKTKGTALDVGAGRGITSFALAKDGWQVTALEPDPSNLVGVGAIRSLFKETALPVNIVQEFGEQLPFPEATFDLVLARQVLHHARDLPQLCREVSRVLKPGGTFLGLRDHVLYRKSDLQEFLNNHPLHNLYGGENAYLISEYLNALTSAPLRVDKVLRSFQTPIHYDRSARMQIGNKISGRLAKWPLMKPVSGLMRREAFLNPALAIASRFDRRPGAAASFICRKAGTG
jgi:SAM-dependent methyltransferase